MFEVAQETPYTPPHPAPRTAGQVPSRPLLRAEHELPEQRSEGQRLTKAPWTHAQSLYSRSRLWSASGTASEEGSWASWLVESPLWLQPYPAWAVTSMGQGTLVPALSVPGKPDSMDEGHALIELFILRCLLPSLLPLGFPFCCVLC